MMSKHDLIEKLKICKNQNNFTLLDGSLPWDILVGYSNGKISLAVDGPVRDIKVRSTRVINIIVYKIDDGNKNRILYELNKNEFEEIFLNLVYDIYSHLSGSNYEDFISESYRRWLLWKSLFKNDLKNVMSVLEIQGLIGELTFMQHFMFERYSIVNAMDAWGGSEYMKKDFQIDFEWFEIKTNLLGSDTIKISSIDQLDSDSEGNLVVVNMERTTPVDASGQNLNTIIEEISEFIGMDLEVLEKFHDKLSNVGYKYSDHYDNYNYIVKNVDFYKVEQSFPRLRKNDLPKGVKDVSYDIIISVIKEYEKKFD